MTKIKLCGLKRPCDIEYVNELVPEYVGFVFAKSSRRYVSESQAQLLRKQLKDGIIPVGVFVDEDMDKIVELVDKKVIQAVQLHGNENNNFIDELRRRTDVAILKAFKIKDRKDVMDANKCSADYVLLDSGEGSGKRFDWTCIQEVRRPYFLAGGLTPENVKIAVTTFAPFAVDASSSLETEGFKDKDKMTAFVRAVRERKD